MRNSTTSYSRDRRDVLRPAAIAATSSASTALARGQAVDAAVPGDVEQHARGVKSGGSSAASPHRRAEVAEVSVRVGAAVPVGVLADGHVRERVDVRARSGSWR